MKLTIADLNHYKDISENDFKDLFQCTFEPNELDDFIDNELNKYYFESDNLNNRDALNLYKEFLRKCEARGASKDDIMRAKRRVG